MLFPTTSRAPISVEVAGEVATKNRQTVPLWRLVEQCFEWAPKGRGHPIHFGPDSLHRTHFSPASLPRTHMQHFRTTCSTCPQEEITQAK